jgi:3-hydroxybutyryl-CoA dehydratase
MNFYVGQKVEETSSYTTDDVKTFAELSGDINPIHLNPEFAQRTPFKKQLVHGFLYASNISKIIANSLPGPGSIYIHQELNFLNPVFHDEQLLTRVEIVEIKKEKNIYVLNTTITKNNSVIVLSGKAVVKLIKYE